MTFQTIPINITGPTYKDRSRPLSTQETRNMYHELVDSGKEKYVLKSFPGQAKLSSVSPGKDRGQHSMSGVAYRVVGNTLYKVSNTFVHTSLGTIPGVDRCIFANDGVNLFIVSDKVITKYSVSTGLTSTVTDPDIVGAKSVAFINNQFAYTFDSLTVFSDVGDGTVATSLNAVGAESNPDILVRDYTFDQVLYRFGLKSCEGWWNSGVGIPPFVRIEGQIINVGLAAIHSVNNSREYIYWLGSDKQVYRARGGQEEPISTAAIAGEIQGFSTISDAYGEVFTIDDKTIYVLTFPAENKTYALIENLGVNGWIELSEGISSGRWNAGSILDEYNKILIGDYQTGDLNLLAINSYDQAGTTWRRRRVIGSVNGDALGQKGKRVKMSRMEFLLETGVGKITGQGDNPRIMLEASYDGGRTWNTGTWLRIGRLGEFNIRAEWFRLHSFYDMVVRLTTSDPIALNIYSATIDLKLAGR